MKFLIVLNDPPYGTERSYNGLRLAREAAALLAMSHALRRPVACLAHVTNAMATRPEDFEKGGHDGQEEALELCARAVAAALAHARRGPTGTGVPSSGSGPR